MPRHDPRHLDSCQYLAEQWFCAADCPLHHVIDVDTRPHHSRGPWRAEKTIKGWYVRREPGSLGEAAIAKVLKRPGGLLEREREAEANARLIAHAPAMRELLALLVHPDTPSAEFAGVSPWLRARLDEARALLDASGFP